MVPMGHSADRRWPGLQGTERRRDGRGMRLGWGVAARLGVGPTGTRRCRALLALLVLFAMLLPQARAEDALSVLTWANYIDPGLVAEFERTSGVPVRFTHFTSDNDRNAMMAARDGAGFDLVLVDGGTIDLYAKQGWLAPLSLPALPNLRHVDAAWRGAYDGARAYGVPYTWGLLGIAYRRDLVSRPIRGWADLFHPPAELRGHILMADDASELCAAASLALGQPVNPTNAAQFAAIERLLQEQRPQVAGYAILDTGEQSPLLLGTVRIAMAYNGDASVLAQMNTNVVFVAPAEGFPLFCDYWCIPARSTLPAAAHRFLDFLCEPSHAASTALFVRYPAPSRAAEALLPPDFLHDPAVYPPSELLARSDFFRTPQGWLAAERNDLTRRLLGPGPAVAP